MHDVFISVVLDDVPDHLYKLDLLIRSLAANADVAADRIIIQHTDRVQPTALAPFLEVGSRVRKINPFLDGRYCNKIRQLHLINEYVPQGAAGILLLDLDIAFAGPLTIPDLDCVAGKVVDAPNPPLSVLLRIFAAADVPAPEIVACDWSGATFSSNLNGGVLYIPMHLCERIATAWAKFASFLYQNTELFSHERERTHIDQIALALALTSTNTPYRALTANDNFPTHSHAPPRTFKPEKSIRALHYHENLDPFGFVKPESELFDVQRAASALDKIAGESSNPTFYLKFKEDRSKRSASFQDLRRDHPLAIGILDWLGRHPHRPVFIFHTGTPKTGTKTLQFFLEENRAQLATCGVFYPDTEGHPEKKHQFLVSQLIAGDEAGFTSSIVSALETMPDGTEKIFFSTEGLFNHWWDFGVEGRSMLKFLSSRLSVKFLTCLRDPVEFATSLYVQYLKNPPIQQCYGCDLSLEEMLEIPWFQRHLDYLGFLQEVEAIIGQGCNHVIPYSSHAPYQILQYLEVGHLGSGLKWRNSSASQQALEMIRVVNRANLPGERRAKILAHISDIDKLLGETREAFIPSPEVVSKIRRLTAKNTTALSLYVAAQSKHAQYE